MTFSNPRKSAEIDNWPIGRQRCRARFEVESDPKRGERVARYTENKTRTGWNKPKRTTYAPVFFIVDGDDGRTYLLSHGGTSGWKNCVVIWPGTMKTCEFVHDDDPRYADLVALVSDPAPGYEPNVPEEVR